MQTKALWVIFVLVVLFVIAGVVRMAKQEKPESDTTHNIEITAIDQMLGPAEAPLTLVEYSDFQCPACASYHSIVKELVAENGDSLRFVYRHYPLPQHEHAKPAAYVAEAAGRQGKFFEMHDMIFAEQDAWVNMTSEEASETFVGYAQALGLDLDRFSADLKDSAIVDKVETDLASGNRFGVNATPTFYLNGRKLQNPAGLDAFRAILQAELGDTAPAATTTATTTEEAATENADQD